MLYKPLIVLNRKMLIYMHDYPDVMLDWYVFVSFQYPPHLQYNTVQSLQILVLDTPNTKSKCVLFFLFFLLFSQTNSLVLCKLEIERNHFYDFKDEYFTIQILLNNHSYYTLR